ncbi:amino acid adenylation domain-containing protein [Rheinheimera riviphila]|uniref:Amino acid adenylation domain-containing protein n=1 Tax=Rheinheimera riviphila TaxID=1834037 RepID=A0A437R246_9GAMM|nr:non-ribosomal peptide synthetase [Rheinheimera riviphila]RVU40793.1 amino acid adenylation domain-containing protein [Rheinheimera riviphila]
MKTSLPGRPGNTPLIELFVQQLARMSQMQHLMSVQLQQLQRPQTSHHRRSAAGLPDAVAAPVAAPLKVQLSASAAVIPSQSQWLPMTSAQRRLYLLCQQPDAELSYHITSLTELTGPLDVSRLDQAMQALADRHQVLRTRLSQQQRAGADELFWQHIQSEAVFGLQCQDWQELDATTLSSRLRHLLQPFDLQQAPLARVYLLQLAPDHHLLLTDFHHAISDGFSLSVFVRELLQHYQGETLPAVSQQYGDYLLWEQQYCQSVRYQQDLQYWQQQSLGNRPPTELPLCRARPARQEFLGGRLFSKLDLNLTQALKQTARQHQVSLFMLLLAGCQLWLSRLCRQSEVQVGVPAVVRGNEAAAHTMGMYTNTLVLHQDIDEQQTLAQLLQQVRARCVGAYQHQALPFADLVNNVASRSQSSARNPLFDVIFVFENADDRVLNLPGLQVRDLPFDPGVSSFDLCLELIEQQGQIALNLHYASALFDTDILQHWLDALLALYQQMTLQPQAKLATLGWLSPAQQQLLAQFQQPPQQPAASSQNNALPVEWRDWQIQQWVAEQARQQPQQTAIQYLEQQLSYQQLDQQANQLANFLLQQGVRYGQRVAISLPRGPQLAVAWLAVAKTGAVFVPVDPDYPHARIRHILTDSAATLLLTESTVVLPELQLPVQWQSESLQPEQGQCQRQDLDLLDLSDFSVTAPPISGDLHSLMYLVYTSGTTGLPKGAQLQHLGVNRLMWEQIPRLGLGPGSRVLQFASFSFDAGLVEFFWALCSGATLYMYPAAVVRDPAALDQVVARDQLTHALMTPALLPYLDVTAWRSVRTLLIGGEACPDVLARLWAEGRCLLNSYGPTETSIYCTQGQLPPDFVRMQMGGSVAEARLYVVDNALSPVPPGVPGELLIGGPGVGAGYLQRPELNAEKFIPNPFAAGQLYRTGDLVRWLPEGQLQYLGRIDHQVKLRGFRIELAEIEAVLLAQPQVREAAVRVLGAGADAELIAYLVAPANVCDEVRTALRATLPDYMVPAALVILAKLPLTANGKLDKQALPLPAADDYQRTLFEPPQGATERLLATIWQQLLQAAQVGRHDNFYALGGHSLLAARLLSQIQQHWPVELGLAAVIGSTDLAELACRIDAAVRDPNIAAPAIPSLKALPPQARYPLSASQQRLWFVERWSAGQRMYHVPLVWQVTGPFVAKFADQALMTLLARHQPLHFGLSEDDDGQLWQQPLPLPASLVQQRDLQHCHESEVQQQVAALLALPFDLATDIKLRAWWLQTAPERGLLVLNLHHIATDGWSMAVLATEFATLYQALCQANAGTASAETLPPLPLQYSDYVLWQQSPDVQRHWQQQLSFWQQVLEDAPPVHQLPLDFDRPEQPSHHGGWHAFTLATQHSTELVQFARQQQVSLFTVLLSAFYLLLEKYSQSRDLVIGTPVANRAQPELGNLAGFFVNTLVLRQQLDPALTLAELLHQVQQQVAQAQQHQEYPFEKLVEALQPVRQSQYSPLFQIMFSMDPPGLADMQFADVSLSKASGAEQHARFELTLEVSTESNAFEFAFEYNADLFSATTIKRLAASYQALLQQMLHSSQQRWDQLDALSAAQRVSLLTGHGTAPTLESFVTDTEANTGAATLLAQLQQFALDTPAATALQHGATALSYQQLWQQSQVVAAALQRDGIVEGAVVALCLQRSVPLLVTVLALLRLGAVYLPLDPAYPDERLQQIIQDAQPVLVLTEPTQAQRFDQAEQPVFVPRCRVLQQCWADWFSAEQLPALQTTVLLLPSADAVAYLIYTSGSTGTPKGVMVGQPQLLHLAHSMKQAYQLQSTDRVLQFSSINFDISIEEIFASWYSGACLVLRQENWIDSPASFWQQVQACQLSVLNLPTAFWSELTTALPDTFDPALRLVIIGGEAAPLQQVRRWLQSTASHIRLINAYGPTETTVTATCYPISSVQPRQHQIPLGRPVGMNRCYILDADRRLLPPGAIGQLWIAGPGVSQGYLRRAEQTAAVFCQDPLGIAVSSNGDLWYHSGDLARWNSDDQLEFFGREDDQVKLNGFRIELSDIEAQILQYRGVCSALVVADQPQGSWRLLAYLRADHQVDIQALRQYLSRKLPQFMLPAALHQLAEWPLLPNGKIDRKALPQPADTAFAHSAGEPPATAAEQQLAQLWQQLLGVAVQSRRSDFFALGGHSLLSIRLLALIRQQFGRELAVRDIFQHSELAAMARLLQEDEQHWPLLVARASVANAAVASEEAGNRTIIATNEAQLLPLSFSQQRLWFIEQLQPGSAQYHISATLQLLEPLDADILEQAANLLTAQHEILRTVMVEQDGQSWQRVMPDAKFSLQRLSIAGRADLSAVAAKHADTPFDLQADLMWRLALVDSGETQFLLFNLHHIAGDGWSVDLLINGLLRCYQQLQHGDASVPVLTLQYGDYALWQQALAQAGYFAQAAHYFNTTLAQLPPVHALPLDFPRPVLPDHRGASISLMINREELQELQQFALSHQTSLFSLCHAAFAHVLARWSGQRDIVIGTPVLNRTQASLQDLVGFFVNTLVLRLDCDPAQHFTALLEQSRQQLHQAQQYQDYPFELLVAALNPPREAAIHPLFQIFMAMDVSDDTALQAHGITLIQPDAVLARFDLSLNLQVQEQQLRLRLDYACALFSERTANALLDALLLTLQQVRIEALRSLGRLPVLSPQQQQLLLAKQPVLTEDRLSFSRHTDLLTQWHQQQVQHADQIAVADPLHALSYQQLEAGANQLAHALYAIGIRPTQRVALLLRRDHQLPMAILALWKLGCAYVPLDPTQPAARQQAVLLDADVQLTLASRCYQALAQQLNLKTLSTDPALATALWVLDAPELLRTLQQQPSTAPELLLPADPLAYLIYTSGSTGQPKGVQVYLSSVLECLNQIAARIGFQPQQAMLAITTVTFDISVLELWLPLLWGGRTVLMQSEEARDPLLLQQWLDRFEIRLLQATPATWQGLILSGWQSRPGLTMLCGGEALSKPLALQLLSGGGTLWNVYGPTEATIWVSAAPIRSEDDFAGQGVAPVCDLLPGVRSYVLSPAGLLQPPGVAGELYLSGPCVAAGYRNRPDLTARHFLPDPFSTSTQTMYRTGDLVRQLPGGQLAFLGRLDHQVKINGFRIELGDIESQLRQHPAVEQAVALVLTVREQPQLVLYWQRCAGVTDDEHSLRTYLQQQLPAYMQPAYWLELDNFPLNSNGKIDRKALPSPQPTRQISQPPATELELVLQQIFQQVLEQQVPDVTVSFFELGGHSLLSIRLMQLLNSQGRTRQWPVLSLADLFHNPDIRRLADHLSAALLQHEDHTRSQDDSVRWVVLEPQAGLPEWWVIPGAGAISAAMLPLARQLRGNAQVQVAEPQGRLGLQNPHQDWATLTSDYLQALRRAQPQGPYHIAGHSLGGRIAYQLACMLEAQGEQVTLCLLDVDLRPMADTGDVLDACSEMYQLLCRAMAQPALEFSDPAQYRGALVQLMQQAGLLPTDDWQTELDALLAVASAQAELYRQFKPGPKFHGPAVLIYGDDFATAHPRTHLRRQLKQYLKGNLQLQQVAGDHLTMLSAPALAQKLIQLLSSV